MRFDVQAFQKENLFFVGFIFDAATQERIIGEREKGENAIRKRTENNTI